jgi:acetoin utilization deacetylase AcuC-like enzyme
MPAPAAPPVLLSHPSSLAHDTGPHPERAERMVAIERELAARDWLGCERAQSPAAAPEAIAAIHPPEYVEAIHRVTAAGGGALDVDTLVSRGSWEAALHAAGGAVELVDRLAAGASPSGVSLHRPPGHHAEPARAMGFCLFNNAAIAARHAIDSHGLERVLILDWDVHHGNGTNDIFHTSPAVLYASIHQSPLYPGTGPAADVGAGEGRGYTLNLPVPPGSGDAAFCSLVEHVVVPVARAFAPQLLLVSAGYDAHADDPLADCAVSDGGYAAMTRSMRRLGAELDAPVGVVLEGGYDLGALARSVAATVEVLARPEPPPPAQIEMHPEAASARARLGEPWRATLG